MRNRGYAIDSDQPAVPTVSGPTGRFWDDHPITAATLVLAILTPAITVTALLTCVYLFDQSLTIPYLIVALIVFVVSFPGRFPKSNSISALAGNVLFPWLLVVTLLVLGWFSGALAFFDQRVILAWALITPLMLLAAHLLVPVALPKLMSTDGVQRVAVIAGGGHLGQRLAAAIGNSPYLGIRIAGYFEDRAPSRARSFSPIPILGSLDRLPDYVKTHRVNLLYITLPMAAQPRILKLLDELRDTTVSIYFAPDIFVVDLIQSRVSTLNGIPLVSMCETPFHGANGILKRASDLVLASVILILISPLMLGIAIGIKLGSPGPVFFKQRRYGLDGQEIVVYKFRSMTVLEDGNEIRQATTADARVTKFGAFLRRTSLDELPQFVNVLQGRMSVVGPRPHAIAHNEQYRKLIDGYMIRHKVRPGITGWAQVNGLRGETDLLEKMQKRIEYDLDYLRHWSFWWDIEIILRTLLVVWKKQNAY